MARVLVLDWDRTSCHLMAGDLNRQGVEVGEAAVWQPEVELSLATAESLGKKLREFLKSSGLPAAPVLACVGRDRVVLKEINYPAVPAGEEPALVRFQATKDLADAAEEVVLDYTPLTEAASGGERHALAVIVRREIVTSFQQLCRSAGLKLLGLVPRPFGIAGCLELARTRRGNLPESSQQNVAVLQIGQRWAELNLLEGPKLLFSRSLGVGPTLNAEVRRCLAVFANPAQGNFPRPAPRVLYLLGNGEVPATVKSLRDLLDLPVHDLDFLTEKEKGRVPGEYQGALAGSLGLLQTWSGKQMPINLASPREPAPVTDHGRRHRVLGAALALAVLMAAWFFGQSVLASKRAEMQSLLDAKAGVADNFKRLAQDQKDLEAIKEWDKGAIPWLDEFYDLAARFPREKGFRLTRIQITPISKPKDRFGASMTIQGIVPAGRYDLVDDFINAMRDPHLRASSPQIKGQSFSIRVDLARQAVGEYRTRLTKGFSPGGEP